MKKESFESALEKIEKILSSLEDEDLPLREKMDKFEEGIELLKFCNKEIKEAEMTLQKIIDKDGKISLEKFE